MAKIVNFPVSSAGRFDLRPVKKASDSTKDLSQLDIFSASDEADVINFIPEGNYFDRAVKEHDKDPGLAVELYMQSIEIGANVADSFCNLGILQSQSGDNIAAIDSFTKSLESDPRHFESHFNLANLYGDAGNISLAKLHYEISREINPSEPSLHYNLAVVLATNQEYESALNSLRDYFQKSGGEHDKEAETLMTLLESSLKKASS